jgi:DNA-binding response OmpR family regulator
MRNILMIVNSFLPPRDSWVITQEGYKLNIVRWEEAELCRLVNEDYDIIIIQADPETEDWELCEQIKKFSCLPLIVISIRASVDTCAQAIDAGADYFLRKPFGPLELNARIKALLQRKSLKPPVPAIV